jgi:hypothetical protein
MRCYDGCPDSELQRRIDAQANARKKIEELGFSVTYFPVEQGYVAFKGYHAVTELHADIEGLLAALEEPKS